MYETDKDGYLVNLDDWSQETAEWLAEQENLQLSDAHWEVIQCLRDYYQTYELSPAMRPMVKYITATLGPEKGRSIYLMQLFPGSTAKIAAKVAGLPRPTNCL